MADGCNPLAWMKACIRAVVANERLEGHVPAPPIAMAATDSATIAAAEPRRTIDRVGAAALTAVRTSTLQGRPKARPAGPRPQAGIIALRSDLYT
jgi:hypothetical protein